MSFPLNICSYDVTKIRHKSVYLLTTKLKRAKIKSKDKNYLFPSCIC